MQLIRDLEPSPRGIYCGAIGLVAPPTQPFRARFSVAIRTAVVDRATGTSVYGVGGGITWGSDPAAERTELHAKAAVLTHDPDDHRLVETLAFEPSTGLRNVALHLGRLADSARYLGFEFDQAAALTHARYALAGRTEPARMRLLLDRAGNVSTEIDELPRPPIGPVRLVVDDDPVDSASHWLLHKTTRRELYSVRARRHPEADDVILTNDRGELTETTIANLAVRLDRQWWTPPTGCGCLPGVERARLLHLGRLHERVLRVDDLAAAEGLAVINSLRGWRPARLLDRSFATADDLRRDRHP